MPVLGNVSSTRRINGVIGIVWGMPFLVRSSLNSIRLEVIPLALLTIHWQRRPDNRCRARQSTKFEAGASSAARRCSSKYVNNIYKYYVACSLTHERRDDAEEARKEFKLRKE